MALAVELRCVSKRFGDIQSLEQVSLAVPAGTVFGFLGPNGAGKTTTLRILLGLLRPDAGDIDVLGLDPRRDPTAVRARIGALLDSDGLYDRLSAYDNLDYHARIRHLPAATRRERIEELLRSFSLWERRKDSVARWSKGMRQKLAVARAMLHRPPLLLLDEPFTGLDPAAAAELRGRLVQAAHSDGVTVLLTTHDLAHVEKACSEVAVISAGSIIARGAPTQLEGSRSDISIVARGDGLAPDLLAGMVRDRIIAAFEIQGAAASITCSREQQKQVGRELVLRGVLLEELQPQRNSLEQTFLSLFARSDAPHDE
jgi:ABC-2 type transport system ATP-binding protein